MVRDRSLVRVAAQVVLVAVRTQEADYFLVTDVQRHFSRSFHQVAYRTGISDDRALGPSIESRSRVNTSVNASQEDSKTLL